MGNCCDKINQFDSEQIYSKLKKECKKEGVKQWKDPKFPASTRLLPGDTSDIKWLR